MLVPRTTRPPALLLAALVALGGSLSVPNSATAASGTLAVHGVTAMATDVRTCDTRIEIGFRPEIADLPLSNGRLDAESVNAETVLVDGAPAAGYATRTDLSVAPFYFATIDMHALTPGSHVISIAGGQDGVSWRAFDHANPTEDYVAHLVGDYHLAFVVPPCGEALPITLSGFAPPIDDAPAVNVARRGSTVALRFSATHGDQPLTDPAEFTVSVSRARCDASAPSDPVERYVQPVRVGELFHDPVAGVFVYRWTVARGKHPCWNVTFTHQAGASVTAHFRTFEAAGSARS